MARPRFIIALTIASLLIASGSLRAGLSDSDKDLIKDAMRNIKSSSDDSRVVRERTENDDVRRLATDIVGGNNKLVDQIREIAQKNDFSYSEEATSPDRKGTKQLQNAKGRDLDRLFLEQSVKDHEEMLAIFKKGADRARDSELRSFFEKKQDAIRAHLDSAKSLLHDLKSRS